ncbi:MAG: hypothetical protein Q4C87_04960 [Actinomycetaceae bacterium]|nr:hypothetical protein [Actinomycetaceae bacterium]
MSDPTQSPYSGMDSSGGYNPYPSGQSQPGWQAPASPSPGGSPTGGGAYPGQPGAPAGQPGAPGGAYPGQPGAPADQPGAPGGAPAGQPGAWGSTASPTWANGASVAPSAQINWTPAQQPGIIPLRPLVLGELFEGSFRSIRANPTVMFGFAVGVMAVLAVLNTAYTIFAGSYLLGLTPQGATQDSLDAAATQLTRLLVGQLAGSLILAIGQTIVTGMLSVTVSDAVLGRVSSVGDAWNRVKGRIGALLVNTLLIWLILVVWSIIVFVIVALITGVLGAGLASAFGDNPGPAVIIIMILAFVLMFGALVAIFALYVKFIFAPTSVVLERTGPIKAISRSWTLTNQGYGRVLGRFIVMILVAFVISMVLGLVTLVFGGIFSAIIPGLALGLNTFLQSIISSLILPLTASMTTLMFIDERMRKEGLATQLAQAANQ